MVGTTAVGVVLFISILSAAAAAAAAFSCRRSSVSGGFIAAAAAFGDVLREIESAVVAAASATATTVDGDDCLLTRLTRSIPSSQRMPRPCLHLRSMPTLYRVVPPDDESARFHVFRARSCTVYCSRPLYFPLFHASGLNPHFTVRAWCIWFGGHRPSKRTERASKISAMVKKLSGLPNDWKPKEVSREPCLLFAQVGVLKASAAVCYWWWCWWW